MNWRYLGASDPKFLTKFGARWSPLWYTWSSRPHVTVAVFAHVVSSLYAEITTALRPLPPLRLPPLLPPPPPLPPVRVLVPVMVPVLDVFVR